MSALFLSISALRSSNPVGVLFIPNAVCSSPDCLRSLFSRALSCAIFLSSTAVLLSMSARSFSRFLYSSLPFTQSSIFLLSCLSFTTVSARSILRLSSAFWDCSTFLSASLRASILASFVLPVISFSTSSAAAPVLPPSGCTVPLSSKRSPLSPAPSTYSPSSVCSSMPEPEPVPEAVSSPGSPYGTGSSSMLLPISSGRESLLHAVPSCIRAPSPPSSSGSIEAPLSRLPASAESSSASSSLSVSASSPCIRLLFASDSASATLPAPRFTPAASALVSVMTAIAPRNPFFSLDCIPSNALNLALAGMISIHITS